ncbi:MAG: insulinase family protein [Treponemataceae bacterium]
MQSVKIRSFAVIAAFSVFVFLSCASDAPAKSVAPVASAAASQASATPAAAGGSGVSLSAAIPFTAALRTGTLPNGLRYYLRENKRPESRILLKLVVNAGSVLETDDEQGLAHFVEHMAFNGTERFPKLTLIDYLRSLGMRFGPEANAYTSFDETVYGIEVPTEIGANGTRMAPERALAVLDDWTRAVLFKADDVESERAIILEEWRMGLGASDRVRRVILPVLFEGSPYASRLPIGLPEIVKNAPSERLTGFYKKWYQPDNMAVIIVGDFDSAKMETMLASHFKGEPVREKTIRPRPDLPVPVRGRVATAIATDAELEYGFVQLSYKRQPAVQGTTVADYRENLLEALVDRMLGIRFLETTVLPKTPYTSAGSGFQRYGARSRFITFSAMTKNGTAEETLRSLLEEKERVSRFGFADDEIEAAKKTILSDLSVSVKERDRLESEGFADELSSHFLRGTPVPDVDWELTTSRRLLSGIAKVDIDAFSRALFADDDLTVLIAAPDSNKVSLPNEKRVKEVVRAVATAKIEPKSSSVISPAGEGLLAARPTAGTVVAENYDKERDIRVWDLSNGARVILKATKNKNDEIMMTALARGGKTSVADEDAVSAAFASGMSERSGLGPYPMPELVKRLTGKQVDLTYSAGDYTRGFRGSSVAEDLETFFQLLRLSFSEPRVDADASQSYMDRIKTLYSQRKDSPEAVFGDRVTSVVSGGHPRFRPLTPERLGEASAEKALRILKKDLSVGDFTFSFAGNIDLEKMRSLVETYLASLPGSRSGRDWTDLGMRRPEGADESVRKGKDQKSEVFMGRYLPTPNVEKTAVVAEGLTEFLDIVLVREIREKLGGVYSISAYASLGAAPEGELSLIVHFSCDPSRVEELSAAVDQKIKAIASGSVDADTLVKAISALKKRREQSLEDNGFIAAVLANLDVIHRRPLNRIYGYGESYDSLKAADISQMAADLMARPRIRVSLHPE